MITNLCTALNLPYESIMAESRRKNFAQMKAAQAIYDYVSYTPHSIHTKYLTVLVWDFLCCLETECHYHGFTLEEAAWANIIKLTDRKNRDVIKGSGDDR